MYNWVRKPLVYVFGKLAKQVGQGQTFKFRYKRFVTDRVVSLEYIWKVFSERYKKGCGYDEAEMEYVII